MKFGRKPAVHTLATLKRALVMARHLDSLGAPPTASNDYVSAVMSRSPTGWGMMGNDSAGDCTCADCGHQVMLHTANAGHFIAPSTTEVLQLYSAITGYNPDDPASDQGANEVEVLQYLKDSGFLGQKVSAFGSVDPQNLNHVRWCNQIFGACRLGINVPQSFMDQFQAGQPISDVGDTNIVGGHDVPIVKYDPQYAYIVTWGKLWPVEWPFIENASYVEEVHAELWPDWLRSQGTAPSGLDMQQLAQDLAAVG